MNTNEITLSERVANSIEDVAEVQLALLETNGHISVVAKKGS